MRWFWWVQGFSVQLLLVKCECRIVSCLQFFLFRFAAWESGNLSWVSINTVKTLSASVHKTLDGNAGGRAGICSDVEFSPERKKRLFFFLQMRQRVLRNPFCCLNYQRTWNEMAKAWPMYTVVCQGGNIWVDVISGLITWWIGWCKLKAEILHGGSYDNHGVFFMWF